MKTAVTFYRVSSIVQDNERQKVDITKYCKGNDFKIVAEFQEKISGASKLEDRIELQKALEYLELNKPDYFVVSELSRLGRTNDVLIIVEKLTEWGICFVCLKENIISLDDDKKINHTTSLMLNILAGVNKFELSTLSYRINSGRANATLKKNHNSFNDSTMPYGYMAEDKLLVVNEEEAIVVKDIFNKYNDGWGFNKIANYLNSKNIPTRKNKQWTKSALFYMLQNELYIGYRKFLSEKKYFEDIQIIDNDIFNNIQVRMKENKNVNSDYNKKKKHFYLLDNGIIKCGICGRNWHAEKRDNIYKCTSTKYKGGCGCKRVKQDWLNHKVVQEIGINHLSILSNNINVESNINTYKDELKIVELNLNKALKSIDNLNDLYIDDKISKSKFNQKYKDLESLIKNLNKQAEEIKTKIANSKPVNFEFEFRYNRDENNNYKFSGFEFDKSLLHKIIKVIKIDNEKVKVTMINEAEFIIDRE